VSHSTCTHRNRVDSRFLVVRSQTASLIPGPSFAYNLCYRCPNGSCEAILDTYTLKPFRRYKEHLNSRCFDSCNWVLNFRESQRTPESHFQECEWRPHTSLKVGLWHQWGPNSILQQVNKPSREGNRKIIEFKSLLHILSHGYPMLEYEAMYDLFANLKVPNNPSMHGSNSTGSTFVKFMYQQVQKTTI
jgi:hypothetical protein